MSSEKGKIGLIQRVIARVRALLPQDWCGEAGKRLGETTKTMSEFVERQGLKPGELAEEAVTLTHRKLEGAASKEHAEAVKAYAEAEKVRIETELARRTLASKTKQSEAEAEKAHEEVLFTKIRKITAELNLILQLKEAGVVPKVDDDGNMTFSLSPAELDWKELERRLTESGQIRQEVNPQDGLEYVWIPPGGYQMGAVPGKDEADEDQKPRHRVVITTGFWLGRTPVTVGAYKRFVRATSREKPQAPSFNSGWEDDDHPIVNVSWEDAKAYCEWAGGRLPTEAEWEYAARGGREGFKYPWGDDISPQRAHYGENREWEGTSPVGHFEANGFGLFDMFGNVWEWCADWYDANYYANSPARDPQGPPTGDTVVVRGGSFLDLRRVADCASRISSHPAPGGVNFGFRCARTES